MFIIENIAITALPEKTVYTVGEALDLTALIVTATYECGASETITGYSVDGFDSAFPGAKAVIISYRGRSANFVVWVKGAEIPDLEMVSVGSGVFMMGSRGDEPGRFSDEAPHEVALTRGFSIGKYAVTQGQYLAVMGQNPSWFGLGTPLETGETDALKRPVERVTWFDAVEFCNMLSLLAGLEPAYAMGDIIRHADGPIAAAVVEADWAANGYRLPTEAEWEYACRAGTITAFHCGTDIYTVAGDYADIAGILGWFSGNSGSKAYQSGLKEPNAWGLYDMHGNVWEWVWDRFANYTGDVTDPTGPATGTYRVKRGGSWGSSAGLLRSAYRDGHTPSDRSNRFGFRVVRP